MICRGQFDSPWNEVVAQHVKAIRFMDQDDFMEAFEAQKELVQ